MKAHANGITQNYELAGKGEYLVLVHGAGDSLRMWYGQVLDLFRRYRILTYDIRGFGESDFPDEPVDVRLLATDLRELLRTLGIDKAYVLGYSMGGRIALQLALDQPSMVRGLVLASSGVGLGQRPPGADERRGRLIEALQRGDIESVAERMTEYSFSPGLKEREPALFGRYRRIKLANKPDAFARVWSAVIQSPPPDVTGLACSVLIIAGENDAFMSIDQARATHAAITGSRLEVLPTGHAAAIEAPDDFNRIVLDFLAEVRRKDGP